MTRPIAIPWGAWAPDRATFESDALVDALNVAPIPGGYGPLNGFTATAATLTPPIYGSAVLSDTQASIFIYAGSGDAVWSSNNGAAFASVYTAGVTLSGLYRWQFVRFVGKVVGIHPQVAPVAGDLGSTMTALTGGAPFARSGGVVGDFLVLGNLDDGIDGVRGNRVRWSGFRDPNAWGTNVGTQADFNDMPDEGGVVQGIIGREFGTVFQRYAISRMTYVGPDTVFQFDVVEKKRGAISPGSIIDAGLVAFYIADDGFFLWDGTTSTPIGASRVDEWFRKMLYPGSQDQIVGAFDPLARTVQWAFATDASGILKHRLIYSITEDRWTHSDLPSACIMSGFDIGYTLEQMDGFGTLDTITFSLDDPKLVGGRARIVGFTPAGAFGYLTGDTLAGMLETGDWQAGPGKRAYINAIRPQADAPLVTCSAGTRAQSLADALSYLADSGKVADGRCPMRGAGRFMRFRATVAASQAWRLTTGIEVSINAEGMR